MRVNFLGLFLSCIALAELSASASSLKVTHSMRSFSPSPPGQRSPEKKGTGGSQPLEPDEDCFTQMDIVFVVDGSSSIRPPNFEEVCSFLSQFISSLPVSADGVHTALVLYASRANVVWDLTSPLSANPEQARLETAQLRQPAGRTATAAAFRSAHDILYGAGSGARPNVPKVVLLLTDGISNNPDETRRAAEELRKRGVIIAVLGVGPHVDDEECLRIVGCGPLEKSCDLFLKSNWENLVAHIRPILRVVCETLPQDAVCSEWSEWTPCSVTCGSGTQEARRRELSPPVDGTPTCPTCEPPKGRSCEEQGGLRREQTCYAGECAVETECGEWGEWGLWSGTCGIVTRSRSRSPSIRSPPAGKGPACEETEETQQGDLGSCGPDCTLGEWGTCTHCVRGKGKRYRHMVLTSDPTVRCEDSPADAETCTDCPVVAPLPGGGGGRSGAAGRAPAILDGSDDTRSKTRGAKSSDPRSSEVSTGEPRSPSESEGVSGQATGAPSEGQGSGEPSAGDRDQKQQRGSGSPPQQGRRQEPSGQQDGEGSSEQQAKAKSEQGSGSGAMIAGGIIGALILAGVAAGGGYYYFKGRKQGPTSSRSQYGDEANAKEAVEQEKEAMVPVDGESKMWAER